MLRVSGLYGRGDALVLMDRRFEYNQVGMHILQREKKSLQREKKSL
jgi:hypothetical protein